MSEAAARLAPKTSASLEFSRLGALLEPPLDQGRGGPGGWIILDEPELHLGRDVLVPDLAAWRRERLPRLPAEAYFSLAPDWVCEIVSPSTASLDRVKKLAIYAREGVRHARLIEPIAQTLEALELREGRWTILRTCAGTDVERVEPFDAIELELGLLWPAEDAPGASG